MTLTGDRAAIRDSLSLLIEPGTVAEVRIPHTGRAGTVSGYFDNTDGAADAAMRWSGKAPGVYVTIDPVKPELRARAANRLRERAEQTTADTDIVRRRWLKCDFDPLRPAGISSTDAEHEAAIERAHTVRDWLIERGFPGKSIILADSGNGAHLLVRVDLPNDDGSRDVVRQCLQALDLHFGDGTVAVDQTTFNAARIWKVYGTPACKGDDIPDRPHRLARLLDVPDVVGVAPNAAIERLAAQAPKQGAGDRNGRRADTAGDFDVAAWLARYGLTVASEAPWQGGHKWILATCPWNTEHTNRSAYVVQFTNGAIAAGCHHNGCAAKGWRDLRALYEPDRPPTGAPWGDGRSHEPAGKPSWPEPPGKAAFAGIAGRIVDCIDPHTEADRTAVLVHFLLGFGNIVDAVAHAQVGATRHALTENAVIVGQTAKARKGESWTPVHHLFQFCDPVWAAVSIKSGLSSGEGLIWAVRDPITKRTPIKERGRIVDYQDEVVDEGVKDKRLLVLEPEFGRVLRVMTRQSSTLSAVIRQAWDSGDLRILTKVNAATATGAHISIIGHVTTEELTRELADTETVNGFANRFLWVAARRSKELPEPVPFAREEVDGLADELTRLVYAARNVERIDRDGDARALWNAVYHDLSAPREGLAGAILARAEPHVLRLSMIYALLGAAQSVRVEHLQAALELWGYVERTVEMVFGDLTGNPTADVILQALRQNGPMARTQISDLFGRHVSSAQIAQALQLLLQTGKAHAAQQATGGRPIEMWTAS